MKTRRRIAPCERRVGGTGAIYKIKRVSKVRGKGKYVRTDRDRVQTAARQLGKVWLGYRFTDKDKGRQDRMVKKIKKEVLKEIGAIPSLDKAVANITDVAVAKLKSVEGEKSEIRVAEVMRDVSVSVMRKIDVLWKELPKEERVSRKYVAYYVKPFAIILEETRKLNEGIFEMKYGKTVTTISKKGKFEDDLDKLEIIDVTKDTKVDNDAGSGQGESK